MDRNIQTFKERGKEIMRHNERRDLTIGEFQQLLENFRQIEWEQGTFDALWTTIDDAFYLGVAVGESIKKKNNKKASA